MTLPRMIELAAALLILGASIWLYRRPKGARRLRQPGRGRAARRRGDHGHPRARRPRLSPEPGRARLFQGARAMKLLRPLRRFSPRGDRAERCSSPPTSRSTRCPTTAAGTTSAISSASSCSASARARPTSSPATSIAAAGSSTPAHGRSSDGRLSRPVGRGDLRRAAPADASPVGPHRRRDGRRLGDAVIGAIAERQQQRAVVAQAASISESPRSASSSSCSAGPSIARARANAEGERYSPRALRGYAAIFFLLGALIIGVGVYSHSKGAH